MHYYVICITARQSATRGYAPWHVWCRLSPMTNNNNNNNNDNDNDNDYNNIIHDYSNIINDNDDIIILIDTCSLHSPHNNRHCVLF